MQNNYNFSYLLLHYITINVFEFLKISTARPTIYEVVKPDFFFLSKLLANFLTLIFPILDKKLSKKPDLIAKAKIEVIIKFNKNKNSVFGIYYLIVLIGL